MERYSAASLFSSDHDEVMAQRQELEDLFHTSTPLEVTRICLTIPIRTSRESGVVCTHVHAASSRVPICTTFVWEFIRHRAHSGLGKPIQ